MIMMSCVMANHLGLVDAVERVIRRKLPVVNCPKCFSFWSSLAYCIISRHAVIPSLLASFLMALLALWFDVFLGLLDKIYYKTYEYAYGDEDNAANVETPKTNNKNHYNAEYEMPEMWWIED